MAPSGWLRVLSWAGLVFLTGFSIFFLVVRFGYAKQPGPQVCYLSSANRRSERQDKHGAGIHSENNAPNPVVHRSGESRASGIVSRYDAREEKARTASLTWSERMFSYVLMRILEGRPRSYDRRINRISGHRVRAMKEEVAGAVPASSRVLEIGCGTGELASMLVSTGCTVDAFDLSPSMVASARERIEAESLEGRFAVRHMGIDAMDGLADRAYDAVVCTLVFSEATDDERRFALRHAYRVLKPEGCLVIADEVLPRSGGRRVLHALLRLPLVAATYLITRSSTRPMEDLVGEVSRAGFLVQKEKRSHGDAFAVVVAWRKPG